MSATYVFQGYKNTYYFRIAISTDLRHIVKRGEIRRSLKTTNYATALRRAQQMYEELQTLFNQLRVQNGMHPFLGKGFEIEGLTIVDPKNETVC